MTSTSAFLGEDLGLDMYKQIDEWFESLEIKQYEYELTGQWETDINEVVGPILADYGIKCDIRSSGDIEQMLSDNNVALIIERCVAQWEPIPTKLVEEVSNALTYIKGTFKDRAKTKSQKTYEIARIGLYSDGSLENSPFDLINDILAIDKIIFSQELEYNGVPYENADRALDDFLIEDKDYLYPEDEEEEDTGEEGEEEIDPENEEEEDTGEEEDVTEELDYHNYVCAPDEDDYLNGLDDDIVDDILDDIERTWSWYISNPRYWGYPDDTFTNGASWGWPFPGDPYTGNYSGVTDPWACDEGSFFCIIVEFQTSNYGLTGWQTMSIESVLKRAAKHLEKPANTSLTQRKMTTNNFELGSIIDNLWETLRGFGIEVSQKPVPILDTKWKNDDLVEWDTFTAKNLLEKYYKNKGLDYQRRNDLDIFDYEAEQQKVIETSAGMPITYPEKRINDLKKFKTALAENNRVLSVWVDKKILQSDMKQFAQQFTELERFVKSMEDFAIGITGIIQEMKKIPTRSS